MMASKRDIKALVVEDAPEMAGQLKRILEKRFDFQVEVAQDCASARSLLDTDGFDIVTLDFMLPDGQGLDILEDITAAGIVPRVIMVTGHGDEESVVRSFRSRASGYVIKDLHLSTRLAEAVEKALVEIGLKQAQEELESREALFRSLTEKSSDIVTVLTPDGVFSYASPSLERFLGYRPAEIEGRNMFDYVHADDLSPVRRMVMVNLADPGSTARMEYRLRHKDGPWRYIESVAHNLVSDPVVSGIVVNSRDVTRRKRAEQELEEYRERLESLVQERTAELADTNVKLREEIGERMQAEAELKDRAENLANFLTVASHELRHPISVVKGYATMLQGYLDRMEPESLAEILSALDISVDRLTGYVDELMEVSLVEEGRFTVNRSEVELAPLFAESVRDRASLGDRNEITVHIEPGAGAGFVDPVRFKQLVDILLDNAIKFSEPASPVDIDARRSDGFTRVSVADRGKGIPAEAAEAVFERFFQLEEVQHHSTIGLGLGLYLAREIVNAHGGTIYMEPREGGGTIFSFSLSSSDRAPEV